MKDIPRRRLVVFGIAFVVLDTLAVGAGMGVPIFAIAFGFVAGWFIPPLAIPAASHQAALRRVLLYAALASAYTLMLMALLWGPTIVWLSKPDAELANFGIPMILYEPRPSFIGWIVLMVLISPFLQLLAALFGACLRLAFKPGSMEE